MPSLIFLQEPYRRLYEALPVLPWIAPFPQARRFKLFGAKSFVVDSILTYALRIQAREELLNAKAFNRILVNSYFSRESVLRAYNLDSSVCYLGINTDLFEPCDAPKQSYVVGLGGISTLKRLNLAILAIASIPSSARPKLVWIGNFSDSSYERLVRDRAIDLSVDVEFKVDISDEELVSIVQTAAVMLYTSHLEPFGYAPLEANACGTAVVAIAEGGVRETIMQNLNGVLISRCSPEDLGKAISVFTQDLAYSAEMAKQARQHVIRYWSLKPKQEALETHLLDLADEKTAVTWSNTGYPLTQL
ncbi:MAG: glycosyltransferase [Cyanobacteria bacterium]|nr:glycosyltransferase [Cyanobacteriota bacterium]